ncbi:DNA polymerase lambda [Nilaparvata lugens]|uniref:DNA polymerase lambda n=1 Tax=Nilaparvata lugens TaxID=108931 RepID=UPI00193CD01B|nr:DNA polymerase lambda [Nilaparvata lugens]
MSRTEVEEIAQEVKEIALSICKDVELMICGSYRRGKQTCGDVDLLLIRPDEVCSKELLTSILVKLRTNGFISDDLTPLESNGNHHKYMGLCKLPGEGRKHRRLDIFVVTEREKAPALMHYTGSALFNRSIRLLASRKSMSLSEHSLSADIFRKGAEKCNEGRRIETPTEESIFKLLGLEYRPPEERDH